MKASHICFGYSKELFFKDLSVIFPHNKITTIIGPNGSGKSTLLMLLGRIYKLKSGTVSLDDKDILDYSLKDFAKKVAVVHQKNGIYGDLDVKTIVGFGRLPYLNFLKKNHEEDHQIIEWAMQITQVKAYENTTMAQLSGGQQQRVWLAMALAQKTEILLLDEPTTYLDVKYQIEFFNLIRKLNEKYHMTIIMVHHDMNQAIHYSDEIIAMKNGQILFQGKSKDIIRNQKLQQIYDYDLKVIEYDKKTVVLNFD